MPGEMARELVARAGEGAAIIGSIVPGDEVRLLEGDPAPPALRSRTRILTLEAGFQHF